VKLFKKTGFLNLGLAATFLMAFGLGCARQGQPTVRLSSWGDVKENLILSNLINEFQKSHPDIKVELLRVPYDDYMTKLSTQLAAGNGPDVIFVSSDDVMNLSMKGTLEPLEEYAKGDSESLVKDTWPSLIADNTINNHLYVIPRDIDPQCDIYYNKKAFDEAHIPYPKDNWTWKEFLADAQALIKKDAKGNTVRWGFVDDAPRLEPWIYSGGGKWVDDSHHPTKFTFNTPEFIRAIQFRGDLINKYKVMPTPSSLKAMGGMGSSDLFLNGATGMFLSGLWHTPEFRDIKDFDWDIAVTPLGPGGKRGFGLGGSGYGILSTSKNKKGAWELVKYIAGPEGQKLMAETGLVFPGLRSVANSKSFLDGQRPLNKKALFKVIPYGVLQPRTMNWREINDGMIVPLFDRVWLGTNTAQEAVSQLYEKLKTVPLVTK
jgi:ABC-type glycerol-3-phosphate transport system substrate-binding protein